MSDQLTPLDVLRSNLEMPLPEVRSRIEDSLASLDPNGNLRHHLVAAFNDKLDEEMILRGATLLQGIRRFSGKGETVLEHTRNIYIMANQIIKNHPRLAAIFLSDLDVRRVFRKIVLHDIGEAGYGDADFTHQVHSTTANHTKVPRDRWDRREQLVSLTLIRSIPVDYDYAQQLAAEYLQYETRDEHHNLEDLFVRWLDVIDGQLGFSDAFPGEIDEEMIRHNLRRLWKATAPLIHYYPAVAEDIISITSSFITTNNFYVNHPQIGQVISDLNEEFGICLGIANKEQAQHTRKLLTVGRISSSCS